MKNTTYWLQPFTGLVFSTVIGKYTPILFSVSTQSWRLTNGVINGLTFRYIWANWRAQLTVKDHLVEGVYDFKIQITFESTLPWCSIKSHWSSITPLEFFVSISPHIKVIVTKNSGYKVSGFVKVPNRRVK